METTKQISRLFKESSIYSIGNFANKLLLFLMVPLYANYIVPSDLSLLEILDPVEQFAYALFHLGITHAFFKHFKTHSDSPEALKTLFSSIFWFLLIEGAVLIAVLSLYSDTVIQWLLPEHPLMRFCFFLMLASLMVRLLNMLTSSYYRVTGKATSLKGWTILGTFLFCTFNFVALTYFDGGIGQVFIARLFLLSPILISGLIAGRKYLTLQLDLGLILKLVRFSYPFILAAAAMPILNFFDRWMLQEFVDANATGIYGISYRFGMIPSMLLVGPFLSAWQPIIYETEKDDKQELLYRRVLLYYTFVGGALWFLLSIFSSELLVLFTSEAYYDGHVIIPFVAGSNVFFGLGWILIAGLAVEGKTLFIGLCTLIGAMANIGLNFLLIPVFGILGAAYATLAAFLILFLGFAGYSLKKLSIQWPYLRFGLILVQAVFFYLVFNLLTFDHIGTGILVKGLLSIPVVVFIGYTAGFTPAKARAIINFIRKS